MQTSPDMTKDRMFKLRLDDTDRQQLDALAEHFSAPAATVVRMLIKEKHGALKLDAGKDDHSVVLDVIEKGGPLGEPIDMTYFDAKIRARLGDEILFTINRILDDLKSGGYVKNVRGKLVRTDKPRPGTSVA